MHTVDIYTVLYTNKLFAFDYVRHLSAIISVIIASNSSSTRGVSGDDNTTGIG